jgi:Site-specific recombinases, DNA invertase Pin homologs
MQLYHIKNLLSNGASVYDIPLRVTYYARVSTESDSQIHSLKSQEEFFEEFIKSKDSWTCACGYVERGISAKSAEKRAVFLKMIDDARDGKFDLILTKEISRFSRSTLDSIKYTQCLLSYGVGVLFLSDNINTLLPDSEVRLAIMASLAQDEIRKLSERVRFGFSRAVKNGVVLGNDRIWGYRKCSGKLVIDESEADIVRLIFSLYADERLGLRKIAALLSERGIYNSNGNCFGCTTIGNIIKNPKYKGYYCAGKTRKTDYRVDKSTAVPQDEWVLYKDEANIPAIVSEDVWDRANNLLKSRSSGGKSECGRYVYSGKIKCGADGKFYRRDVYKNKSGERELWVCGMCADHGKSACNAPKVYTSDLDAIVREIAAANTATDGAVSEVIGEVTVKQSSNAKVIFLSVISPLFDDVIECRIDIAGRKRTPFCFISSESYTT